MDSLLEDNTIKLMIDEAAGDIDNVPLPSDGESVVGSVLNEQLANLGEHLIDEHLIDEIFRIRRNSRK